MQLRNCALCIEGGDDADVAISRTQMSNSIYCKGKIDNLKIGTVSVAHQIKINFYLMFGEFSIRNCNREMFIAFGFLFGTFALLLLFVCSFKRCMYLSISFFVCCLSLRLNRRIHRCDVQNCVQLAFAYRYSGCCSAHNDANFGPVCNVTMRNVRFNIILGWQDIHYYYSIN